MARRKRTPADVETVVLVASRRRCCLCYYWDEVTGRKRGQIAHINRNSQDPRFDNLVFLCAEHHDEYDSPTSQSKGITAGELRVLRDQLYKELDSKRLILNQNIDVAPVETPEGDEPSDYEKVMRRFAGKLDFIREPWRYAFWLTANEPEFFAYKARNGADGVCLIERIDIPDGRTVIVCIQTAGNPGNSITNCVESLCFQVCERFEIDPTKLVWLEHYDYDPHLPQDGWRMVTFSGYPPKRPFEDPEWVDLTPALWRSLMLRPRRRASARLSRIESKVQKLFEWPTKAMLDS